VRPQERGAGPIPTSGAPAAVHAGIVARNSTGVSGLKPALTATYVLNSMRAGKTKKSLAAHRSDLGAVREEHEIFSELAVLCASPGFAHAIAFFSYRDNLLRVGNELTSNDLANSHSGSRLIRTEISTLIGLLARQPINYTLPEPAVIQGYIDRAQALLHELHRALSSLWFRGIDAETLKDRGTAVLSAGPALREPIFYGGDSAYSFQYREFSEKKYASDRD
jgi:hypothetical protein